MSTYAIVYLESITDPSRLTEYRRIGVPTLQESGAKVLVRNGKFEVKEGPMPQGVVMLEFPSMEAANTWYHSPKYQEALQHRFAGAVCRVVFVEGV
jgi:uncharacterized protein (DUF1330 family)